MVTSKKTRLNRSPSQQTEPFPIWTENSALLHRKRQNWTVPHRNHASLTFVILSKTEFHATIPKILTWFTSQKESFNLIQPCSKDWTGSHHKSKHRIRPWITNDEWWIKNDEWWMMIVFFEMLNWKEPSIYFESITKVRLSNRELCIDIEKDKTEPSLIPTQNLVTATKTRLNRSPSQHTPAS